MRRPVRLEVHCLADGFNVYNVKRKVSKHKWVSLLTIIREQNQPILAEELNIDERKDLTPTILQD